MPVDILTGDCREILRTLPSESVHCVVTSPPYWGLRDYDVPDQLGLEPIMHEHLENMVAIFREVRRVLRSDGTFWLNYGDCYATAAGRVGSRPGGGQQGSRWSGPTTQPNRLPQAGLKPKDLCMMPNRLAIALQDDGWWVRSENVWGKPNARPESVRDRPGMAHEKVFMLTKSMRYFYDAEAVRQGRRSGAGDKVPSSWDTQPGAHGRIHRKGRERENSAPGPIMSPFATDSSVRKSS